MMSPVEPTAAVSVAEAVSWVATARRLAADGALPDAVAAYERAVRALHPAEADSAWRIELLGRFAVHRDAGPVHLGALRPQHRALLQVLCLHGGRPVPDRQVCAWFWPDTPPERARHRLAVGASAIRMLLVAASGPRLICDNRCYQLDLDPDQSDVGRFEQLVGAAHAAPRPERASRWEAALASYGGDLLPAAGDAEWVVEERDRLRARAVDVAADLADAYARAARARDVVRVARIGLRLDGHHDRLWRRLVQALDTLGEPAAAATARRDYAVVLADLGVGIHPWPDSDRRRSSA